MFFGRLVPFGYRFKHVSMNFVPDCESHLAPELGTQKSVADAAHEIHHYLLRPASVTARGLGEESAVSAMRGLDEVNIRIGHEFGASWRENADEGVIFGVDDQCGNPDALQN